VKQANILLRSFISVASFSAQIAIEGSGGLVSLLPDSMTGGWLESHLNWVGLNCQMFSDTVGF